MNTELDAGKDAKAQIKMNMWGNLTSGFDDQSGLYVPKYTLWKAPDGYTKKKNGALGLFTKTKKKEEPPVPKVEGLSDMKN